MKRFIYEVTIGHDESGFYAYVPDLEGCFGGGDTLEEVYSSIIDGLETHIESLVVYGMDIPKATFGNKPSEGETISVVSFYINADVVGGYVSATEAAKILGVTKARVSHMIRDGILEAYRKDSSTYVTKNSIEKRLASFSHSKS